MNCSEAWVAPMLEQCWGLCLSFINASCKEWLVVDTIVSLYVLLRVGRANLCDVFPFPRLMRVAWSSLYLLKDTRANWNYADNSIC